MKNSSLNRFHILSSFLREKPYAFSLSWDKSREIVNREFFERQVINTSAYAGNFGLRNEFIPAGFSFNNSSKVIDRALRPSQNFQDDAMSLNLSNNSENAGQTYLDATQDKFSRTESGTPEQKGTSRDFNLANQKMLSEDNKELLYSTLRFYDLSEAGKSRIFDWNENLNIEHSDSLSSSYGYSLQDNTSSGTKTQDNKLSASLKHRLYESLYSSLGLNYFNSRANTFSQNSYGLFLNEDYVKKLGRVGRLSSGIGLTYSEEKNKALNNTISIIDEPLTLTTGSVTLLDKAGVDTSTLVVTDSTGNTRYTSGIDYQISSVGGRTQIQIMPGPAGKISEGQIVLVDYQVKSEPLLRFNTLGENFNFRIDFLEGLVGLFYRLNKESHPRVSGGEKTILQTLSEEITGLDFHYNNLEIGLEKQDYGSSLSPYQQLKLKESYTLNLVPRSTLTLQSSQSRIRLVNTQDTQRFFDFVSRYSLGLSRYSRLNTEAGFRWQQGLGINLNDLILSSSLQTDLGQFAMDLRYDFKKQRYLGDNLIGHFFSTRLKRRF